MMEMEFWLLAILCFVFFAAGFIDSVAGGGGLITLPMLLLAGVPPANAIATSKLAGTCGTAVSLISFARGGFVVWKLAILGLPLALLAGMLGSNTLLLFDNELIKQIIVVLLPIAILVTLFPKKQCAPIQELDNRKIYVYTPLICCTIGFYEGFFGPGAGSFFILAFHHILGLDFIRASASTKVFNFAAGLSALIVFLWYGKVLLNIGIPLAIATMLGNALGARMAMKIGAEFIRKVLLVSLAILFASVVAKFFF